LAAAGFTSIVPAQGGPTVVLEAASGGSSPDWCLVQPEIAKFTRVCSYDRAGLGWSDSSPRPRSMPQIAEDLSNLLAGAGIEGPYVLVGHSLGGLYVQYLARRHPGRVAGLVLVDAAHPDLFAHQSPEFARRTRIELRKRWLAARLWPGPVDIQKPTGSCQAYLAQ